MKARPILFSRHMVRAILESRKTQTRRIIKPQPYACDGEFVSQFEDSNGDPVLIGDKRFLDRCRYGKLGDRLWVREEHYRYGHWEEVHGVRTKLGRQKWRFVADTDEVLYDPPASFRKGRHHRDPFTSAWHKPLARFMPRTASRIDLEVVSVRVEMLHDIIDEDAVAEGVSGDECIRFNHPFVADQPLPAMCYANLWESINGPGSWDINPLVWVVEFRRVKP